MTAEASKAAQFSGLSKVCKEAITPIVWNSINLEKGIRSLKPLICGSYHFVANPQQFSKKMKNNCGRRRDNDFFGRYHALHFYWFGSGEESNQRTSVKILASGNLNGLQTSEFTLVPVFQIQWGWVRANHPFLDFSLKPWCRPMRSCITKN